MITFDIIVVFVVLLFILVSLYKEILGATFTFVIAVSALGFFGILTPREILSGFANEQIFIIILLLLIGDIIRRTGFLEDMFDRIFRSAKTQRGFMGRMMLLIAGFSAFLNNTPLVAIMMPYVNTWSKKNGISPSKLLMPLSFAAILGGCATLIGTSTNLIVSGMAADQNIVEDIGALNIFEFSYVGVPMIVLGLIFLYFFSDRLLPSKSDVMEDFSRNSREYLVEAQVRPNSPLVGKTIEEAGLRNLKGLFLVEIIRGDHRFKAVSPDVMLEEDDILLFAGDTNTIADMIKSKNGLTLPSVGMMHRKKKTEVVEIVISQNSSLIGKTVKEVRFRARYDAAVIAVHRNGEKISGKIGEIVLKPGDVLLVFTGEDFFNRTAHTKDFYFISKVRDFQKVEGYKIAAVFGGLLLAILLSAFHVISLFMGLVVIIIAAFALGLANPKELPKAIDYDLALIIVLSLALGVAMRKSGAAELVADMIVAGFLPFGKIGLLIGIYLITAFLGAYIGNKAAVALVFPISLTMSVNLDLPPMPFILVVSFAAAANFLTPIGYQTNLMVYGPGGYSFKDFFRLGLPLTVLYMIVTVVILSLIYFV